MDKKEIQAEMEAAEFNEKVKADRIKNPKSVTTPQHRQFLQRIKNGSVDSSKATKH